MAVTKKRRAVKARGKGATSPKTAATVLDLLEKAHPEARCALDYRTPFELAVATILSAQCTDERVNKVTPLLFARYPAAPDLADASPSDVEAIIRSTGFFRAKTKSVIGFARDLVEKHGGELPRTIPEMTKLPGIGRKTANVVLGHAFGINEGIAVDTHVLRVTNRLGLAKGDDPIKVEAQLMVQIPRERWTRTTDLIIFHGRKVCDARRPACGRCSLFGLCRWEGREARAASPAGERSSPSKPRGAARRPNRARKRPKSKGR